MSVPTVPLPVMNGTRLAILVGSMSWNSLAGSSLVVGVTVFSLLKKVVTAVAKAGALAGLKPRKSRIVLKND